jgi:hypothetical protein
MFAHQSQQGQYTQEYTSITNHCSSYHHHDGPIKPPATFRRRLRPGHTLGPNTRHAIRSRRSLHAQRRCANRLRSPRTQPHRSPTGLPPPRDRTCKLLQLRERTPPGPTVVCILRPINRHCNRRQHHGRRHGDIAVLKRRPVSASRPGRSTAQLWPRRRRAGRTNQEDKVTWPESECVGETAELERGGLQACVQCQVGRGDQGGCWVWDGRGEEGNGPVSAAIMVLKSWGLAI